MGRRRGAVTGRGHGGGRMPVLLALIGAPGLILALLLGSAAPPGRPAAPAPLPLSSASPSPGSPTHSDNPAVPTSAPAAPLARAVGRTQYLAGRSVALRAEPNAAGAILVRYEGGQAIEVLGRSGAWTHVRHALTQREGWIQAKRLQDEPPSGDTEPPPAARPAKALPALSAAAITKLLIERSVAAYPGPCACPYQSARNGSSCGRRAAYVRPGGYAPLCYAKDVTPEMIAAYRAER